jgi:ketosteroid isomerase-like protein
MTLESKAVPAEDAAEVRALFLRQVEAENAHDIAGIDAVIAAELAGSEDAPMFVARAGQFFGREAVLQRFRDNFSGTWKFEPEAAEIRITPIGADTIHVFAPTRITVGPAGQEPRTLLFLVNQIAVRTGRGWRFAVIIPVPANWR